LLLPGANPLTRPPCARQDPSRTNHWLPRAAFTRLLARAVRSPPYSGRVTIETSSAVKALRRGPGGVEVVVAGPGGEVVYKPQLVLGCDGANSAVRAALREWAAGDAALREAYGSFETTSLPCLSAGLRFKVLPLPANPALKDGEALENPGFVLLQGGPAKALGRATPIRLGLLPFKEPDMPRTGNLITEDGAWRAGRGMAQLAAVGAAARPPSCWHLSSLHTSPLPPHHAKPAHPSPGPPLHRPRPPHLGGQRRRHHVCDL
jgi:hypothetical protein